MPRGKSKSPQSVKPAPDTSAPRKIQRDDEWGGFVNLSIDEAHKEGFELWASEAGPEVYRELDDALGVGLKFTLAYDGGNQCYIASLTGRPDVKGEQPFTCCLSARAGTFEEAIAVLMYKHASLLHHDWWDVVNAPKAGRYTFG